jgi:hypothetical protein
VWGRSIAAAGLGVALAFHAQAADLAPVSPEPPSPVLAPGWQFQATLYGWASAVSGNVGVGRLPDATVDVTFPDLLDVLHNLEGAFMGTFIARDEALIFGIDLIWSKISDNVNLKAGTGSLAPFRSGSLVDLEETQTIATGFAGIRLPLGSPDLHLYATAGARYQRLGVTLTLTQAVLDFSSTNESSVDWVDPIIGLAGQYRINEKWFINGLADFGGFGVGAKIDTQGLLAVGYNWTPSFATTFGFRALYTDYSSGNGPGSFRYKTTMYGPFAGISLLF